jgi:alkylhydroperoxidase/carboxymuconolactone decarboxylase family protein YurZ
MDSKTTPRKLTVRGRTGIDLVSSSAPPGGARRVGGAPPAVMNGSAGECFTAAGSGGRHPSRLRRLRRAERRRVVDGALDPKSQELIAPPIAATKQCGGFHSFRARGGARRGAIVEEVAGASGVAIVMNDRTAIVHARGAFAALQELAQR